MFTLGVYLTGSLFLSSGASALLFWGLTSFVVWGFVDVCLNSSSKFEAVGQSRAGWIVGHVVLGPVATCGWLVVRKKVKAAQPLPAAPLGGAPAQRAPYPYEQAYVPAHRHPSDEGVDGSPPFR